MSIVCQFGLHWLYSHNPMTGWIPHIPMCYQKTTVYSVLYTLLYTVLYNKLYPGLKVAGWPDSEEYTDPAPCKLPLTLCSTLYWIIHRILYFILYCTLYCTLYFTLHSTQTPKLLADMALFLRMIYLPAYCTFFAEHYIVQITVHYNIHFTVQN